MTALIDLILNGHVEEFNRLRIRDAGQRLDLSKQTFRHKILRDILLVNVVLDGCDLEGSDLQRAVFCNSSIRDAQLSNCLLVDAQFGPLEVVDAKLPEEFRRHLLYPAVLCGTSFVQSNLLGANLRETDVEDADFQYAILAQADLRRANHAKAFFEEAITKGIRLK